MSSGARKARHDHPQRDDDPSSNPSTSTRCWRWCRYWCWYWCWYWWWWWWCWARGRSCSNVNVNVTDNNDDNNDEEEEEEEKENDAQPISSDGQRAWRWRRSLASVLLLTGLLSDRLGPACASLGTDMETELGTETGSGMGMGMGTGTGHEPCSLRSKEDVILIANCSSENCLTFLDADHLCRGLWGALAGAGAEGRAEGVEGEWSAMAARLRLSFCDSYSLMDLLEGRSRPDLLNCSVSAMRAGDLERCSMCVQAYQSYDVHAQEKYEEFELLTERYVTDAYSVRTCMEECKVVYKPWLCAQFFQSNQSNCSRKVPCEQYCLEVQQRCPFILPDNDDLIHGGTPSFICTGLSEKRNAEQEPQCCDVRWDLKSSNRSRGTFKRTHPSCQHGSSATSGAAASSRAPRLGQGRLKLCLLVLVLLHTMATMTASQNSTCLAGIFALEDNTPREE